MLAAIDPDSIEPAGRVTFCRALDRDAEAQSLRTAGFVVIELEGIGPSARGRLAEVIDDAVEQEFALRGAAGAGCGFTRDRDAALSDQLFRARRFGGLGLALVLGPLRGAANPVGALEPEDSETLAFLAQATRERPLVLVLDERDEKTGGYGAPIALKTLLASTTSAPALEPTPTPRLAPTPTPRLAPAPALEPALELTPAPPPALTPMPPLAAHVAGASVVGAEEHWRAWLLQLVAARGPQPLSSLEKLFTDTYTPLAAAVGLGLEDPRARAAVEEFRASFARSYAEAFPTLSATQKRPRMVLDVHEMAGRISRLHGARQTRMLLVDAMRWDVARLVQARLGARLGERAALTEELLLWSALPTTTMRQLETIARGVDALRTPGEIDADAEPPRGRTAEYVRRLRIGPREVHKLDIIEARLLGARGMVLRALPEIAEATAEAIARHAATLAPNTLLFVFGDHGFTVDKTGTARQGGASPEEVLVGAFAFLVGDVH
ncbi:MAG TPA: hypothetical protein VHV30_11165 [Polyangiaceae bacterium]|nr:hypothetical protein [Polyangiaceae bacterium]